MPQDPATLYGFVIGQPGDIVVNFTANPRPTRVAWVIDDGPRFEVEPFGGASGDSRVERVYELKNTVRSRQPNNSHTTSNLLSGLIHLSET